MDRVLKIIYNDRYLLNDRYEMLLNGVHPSVISYIQKFAGTNRDLDSIIQEIAAGNDNQDWSCFFRHANFLGYSNKYFTKETIVKIEDIVDDNAIYLLPIEIGGSLADFVRDFVITVDGTTYNYKFIDTLDPKIVEYLKVGKVKLLINMIHDPLHSVDRVYQVEQYFKDCGIDGSNIIVIGGNNFQEYYQHKPDSKIKITYGYIMVQQAGDRLNHFPYISSLGYVSDAVREADLDNTKIRPKKFLCWNRTMRAHRYWLAYLMFKYGMSKNGYFSFLVPAGAGLHNAVSALIEYTHNTNISQLFGNLIHSKLPIELDTHALNEQQKTGFTTNNNKKEFYLNSYVHITSETAFTEPFTSSPFFSEKTFHAMVNLQPFIYVGSPGALQQLKAWGIKTFHPFIDESYDNEYDPVLRFQMIEKEIKKLNDMSLEQLHEWYYSITDILIHNQNNLISFSGTNPFEIALKDIQKFYP